MGDKLVFKGYWVDSDVKVDKVKYDEMHKFISVRSGDMTVAVVTGKENVEKVIDNVDGYVVDKKVKLSIPDVYFIWKLEGVSIGRALRDVDKNNVGLNLKHPSVHVVWDKEN